MSRAKCLAVWTKTKFFMEPQPFLRNLKQHYLFDGAHYIDKNYALSM